ncbi:copper amine oxidase domain protein [Desulfofarcimen acetoxidans DSM 771]|uniref:Copper amine oxidase domain protein n=1 Tax=Desulfofarcimen acetoxidans (strain ATCC 49208 / DSM 771 / KCTC 5769 / VKM B-1644 / 5575) TaxID=485916 RepID=C8W626_DESAS|nr:stalk domain-containing protein [Desulfofarcimen acetoxidans]ACV61481.1 copper amine oxidase domain protein [Desulfofarcimen acetoxidans DSM 771]
MLLRSYSGCVAVILFVLLVFPALAQAQQSADIKPSMDKAVKYLLDYEKEQNRPLSLWSYTAMAAAGQNLDNTKVEQALLQQLNVSEATAEYGLLVIALVAAGENPYDYRGQNFIGKIQSACLPDGKFADNIDGSGQGDGGEQVLANAHIWAVLALHAAGADSQDAARQKEWLISQQHEDGGFNWCVSDKKSDVDSTGMALMALGALGEREDSITVKKAYAYLKSVQESDGGFASWGASNAESCGMVIEGLTAVGIKPAAEEMNNAGGNPVAAMLNYQLTNGSFAHIKGSGANEIATYQALMALSDEYYGKCIYQRLADKSLGNQVPAVRKIKFRVDENDYEVQANGQTSLEEADVAPFLLNGRTYVPLRYLAQALVIPEAGILWSPEEQTITLNHNGITVKLAVGSNLIYVNNVALSPMDIVPVIKNDRVFLPARYVAESFGCQVAWQEATQTVIITQ